MFNNCDKLAIQALRYLADNERPRGGEDKFNSIHLLQIASELENELKNLCRHNWTILSEYNLVNEAGHSIGQRYALQCSHCGDITKRDVSDAYL